MNKIAARSGTQHDGLEPEGGFKHRPALVTRFHNKIAPYAAGKNVPRQFRERHRGLVLDRVQIGKLNANVILDEGVVIASVEKIEGHRRLNRREATMFPLFGRKV